MSIAQDIARVLLENEAVKISTDPPFTWTSGMKSPIYCDNRILTSYLEARETVLDAFLKTIEESGLEFDSVAGVSTGAITWGMLVADRLEKPFSYIRTKPKGHGAGKQVEGVVRKGEKVLVIEDSFSTAGSSVAAVEGMRRETGADVVGVIAISTYEFEKARKALEDAQVKWWTLTNFSTLVQELDVSEEQKNMITKFAENPAEWWDNYNQ